MIRYLLFLLAFLISKGAYSQVQNIDKILKSNSFNHASVGLVIKDLDNDELIYSHNADLSLIPASTLKLLTTFSALEYYSPDHKFRTDIFYQGEILGDGSLYGNIIVKGGGDPTLGSTKFSIVLSHEEIFQKIIRALKRQNITCIEGDILFDNSLFGGEAINNTWKWNDIGNYYAAGSWAFNFNENLFDIQFERAHTPYSWTKLSSISPYLDQIRLKSYVTTGAEGSGDNAYVYAHPYSMDMIVKGTIPPGKGIFKIQAALPDPSMLFKSLFSKALNRNEMQVGGAEINSNSASQHLTTIESPSLSEIVYHANLKSNNLYCETLLRDTGAQHSQKGSTESGIDAIINLLEQNDVITSSLTLVDGSGLSSKNRIASQTYVDFISLIYRKYGFGYFETHLSDFKSGGYKSVFKNLKGDFNLVLKSGSISQVQGYVGILETDNKRYAFAFMSNGHKVSNRLIRTEFAKIIESLI